MQQVRCQVRTVRPDDGTQVSIHRDTAEERLIFEWAEHAIVIAHQPIEIHDTGQTIRKGETEPTAC